MANLETQFVALLETGDQAALFDFLYARSFGERRKLASRLQKQMKAWETEDTSRTERFGTPERKELFQLAAVFCFNRRQYEKSRFFWLRPIRKWLHRWSPDWLEEHFTAQEFISLRYEDLMQMEMHGHYEASPESVMKCLPSYIWESGHKTEDGHSISSSQQLLRYPQTIETHLFWLFQYPSAIHTDHRYQYAERNQTPAWYRCLEELIAEGHLDKLEILRLALRATTLSFNQSLTYWFVNLYVHLKAEEADVLVLQDELLACLQVQHSKVVRIALKELK
ncbi:MAG: DUF6493 family protein, partial [Bacteroidota bacterium]